MNKRSNPFVPIYRIVNHGSNQEKYHEILMGGYNASGIPGH